MQLATAGGSFSSDPPVLVTDGMAVATMNDRDPLPLSHECWKHGVRQLATLDLNPISLGDAPSVTGAIVDPDFLLSQSRSGATVQAQVSASPPVVRVSGVVLKNGLVNPNIAPPVLLDDGRNGDVTAGDNLFKGNLSADYWLEIGPRTVRIKAELRASDGRRHTTAIELAPFEVRQ